MKEFLEPMPNGDFRYHKDDGVMIGGDWIEIPEGAEIYLDNTCFYKFGNPSKVYISHEWEDVAEGYHTVSDFIKAGNVVLWQREKVEVEDSINQPSHYTSGGIECLDAMQAMLSKDEFIGFLRGNVFKYNWRYKLKNGIEDLKKAKFYQDKLIEVESK